MLDCKLCRSRVGYGNGFMLYIIGYRQNRKMVYKYQCSLGISTLIVPEPAYCLVPFSVVNHIDLPLQPVSYIMTYQVIYHRVYIGQGDSCQPWKTLMNMSCWEGIL